jgi:hypothetical protein
MVRRGGIAPFTSAARESLPRSTGSRNEASSSCGASALARRTGDERWLERARAFAMHGAQQVERARTEHGRGRYSLWTGDVGTALYLADCVDGGGEPPLP